MGMHFKRVRFYSPWRHISFIRVEAVSNDTIIFFSLNNTTDFFFRLNMLTPIPSCTYYEDGSA